MAAILQEILDNEDHHNYHHRKNDSDTDDDTDNDHHQDGLVSQDYDMEQIQCSLEKTKQNESDDHGRDNDDHLDEDNFEVAFEETNKTELRNHEKPNDGSVVDHDVDISNGGKTRSAWLTRPEKFVVVVWVSTLLSSAILYLTIPWMVVQNSDSDSRAAQVASQGPAVLLRSARAQEDMCAAYGITFTPYFVLLLKTVFFQLVFLVSKGGATQTWNHKRSPLTWFGAFFAAFQLLVGLFNFGTVYLEYVRAHRGPSTKNITPWDSYQWYLLLMVQSSFYETGLQFLAEAFFLVQGIFVFQKKREKRESHCSAIQRLHQRQIDDDDERAKSDEVPSSRLGTTAIKAANEKELGRKENGIESWSHLLSAQPIFFVYHVMLGSELEQQRPGEGESAVPSAALSGLPEAAGEDEEIGGVTFSIARSSNVKHLALSLLSSVLILPALPVSLLTHVLPMTLAFVWMGLLGFFLVPAMVSVVPQILPGRLPDEARAMWAYLCWKTCLVMFGTLTFQSTVTFGILLFSGEPYLNVVGIEWNLRSLFPWLACIRSALTGRLSTISDVMALI